MGMYSKTLK